MEWNDALGASINNGVHLRGKIALQLHAGGQGNMEFKDVFFLAYFARATFVTVQSSG